MGSIIIVVVLGAVAWYLHTKKGVKWGSMLAYAGMGLLALIGLANKLERGKYQQVSRDMDRFSGMSNRDLTNFVNDFNQSATERQHANGVLNARKKSGTYHP